MTETDKEKASNAYIMSLIAVAMGLPMPIINLIATGVFYLFSRGGTFYLRWHATQAFISQVPLFVLNNILFWWTVRILFMGHPLSSVYIAYFILVNIYNIVDFYATAVSAVRSRKGISYRWFLYGVLTDMIVKPSSEDNVQADTYVCSDTMKRGDLLRRAGLQSAISLLIFVLSLTMINAMDWMRMCGLKPYAVEAWAGDVLWKYTSSQLTEVHDPAVFLPVDSISTHICLANGIDTALVKLHVCRTHEVNAYAMLGRRLMINTALIRACHNEQELAGVMAHELAHIQNNHVQQSVRLQLLVTVVGQLLGGVSVDGGDNIDNVAQTLVRNYYMRGKEREADSVAVRYMLKAGIDPAGLSDFLDRMDSLGMLEFLSDHPDSKKRAEFINKFIGENANGVRYHDILSPNTWEQMQNSIQYSSLPSTHSSQY